MRLALSLGLLLHHPAAVVRAAPAGTGLLDPDLQPKFAATVPNPLDPSFVYAHGETSRGDPFVVGVGEGVAATGLVDESDGITPLGTPIWGYGVDSVYTWPGKTFEVQKDEMLYVHWKNNIPIENGFLLTGKDNGELGNFLGQSVVDTSYHWCYSLEGYLGYTIETHGTPIVPHLHGGHTVDKFDGNPEYFFTPDFGVKGPQWHSEVYEYENRQPASLIWYHDHALGITRLNVYAGMAGGYVVRDEQDTGKADNPLKLPAYPYEIPLIVQDRMFKENGELFYPAFSGDPFYKDFITDEEAWVGDDDPSALAEFFGDFIVVNGKIWPKLEVEPRKYRLRLLNGCDSRFMVLEFFAAAGSLIPFHVIGGDQGLAESAVETTRVVFEPSARHDIVIDFSSFDQQRIVLRNTGGDEPFGGDIPGPQAFNHTDKVMAFDVVLQLDTTVPDDFNPDAISVPVQDTAPARIRKLALFEGHDQLGRLQPLLGTAEPATDKDGNPIHWPDTKLYREAGLVGPMEGAMPWHAPTTENPNVGDTEDWEIWNVSADAHPIHVHLVSFQLVKRQHIVFDSNVNDDGEIEFHEPDHLPPAGDGTYTVDQPLVQHDGSIGEGYIIKNPTVGELVDESTLPEYLSNFPRDVITALPGQITTIRITFEKEGRFNWHCHILSHEDHEMMRLYHVGPLPKDQSPYSDRTDVGEDEDGGDGKNNTGAITRGVVGGVLGLAIVGWALLSIFGKPGAQRGKSTDSSTTSNDNKEVAAEQAVAESTERIHDDEKVNPAKEAEA